ncbi:MAG: phospholipase D family protein [Clostridia bacterium]|nr:phospholipase D family protein [Clostridia bacterium]
MVWVKKTVYIILMIVILVTLYGAFKPLPQGLGWEGELFDEANVQFIYDLTYEQEGQIVHQQNIFQKALQIINEAEDFIILDMFLFNDNYDPEYEFPQLTATLTQALVQKKRENPNVYIALLTDEINTFYGCYFPKHLEELQEKGIEVVITDLNALRDSNPLYSGLWNTFMRWSGTKGKGWLPNAFSSQAPKVTARAYLKMFNFKANHRKVLITEKKALLTSANFHDASAFHSNIAFVVEGGIIGDMLASEKAVAAFSGVELPLVYPAGQTKNEEAMKKLISPAWQDNSPQVEVCLLTEGKIKKHLLEAIKKAEQGDSIWAGMFYLSDRKVIKELLKASWRGVEVRLVLDPNKDAFGFEKIGIPNRPVADELIKESEEKIKIRWYKTHGEQYHTKLVFIRGRGKSVILGGSANLTKRNLNNYNLESNLKIVADNESMIVKDLENYFQRIWNNTRGLYTVDLAEYREESIVKRFLYLFQEWSGFSTV